jgi:hypothetical protein
MNWMVSTNLFWKNSENKEPKALLKKTNANTVLVRHNIVIEALSTEKMY